jgi:hypothetical protein
MPTNLQPLSVVSAVVLPATGNLTDVEEALAYGIYTEGGDSQLGVRSFISGAVDQVAYVYNKLGGNVLDLEITPSNVYNAYEEACLEYSYLINTHQAKNVLSDLLGNTTGSFNQDGEFTEYSGSDGIDGKPNLKFPRFQLGFAMHVGRGASVHADVGASQTIYSASFDAVRSVQDYDLQKIIYSASLDTGSPFYGKVGKNAITVQNVYFKTPRASWRFFGGNPVGTLGNLSTYGMYADDSTFEIVPAWQNTLQAMTYENDLNVRASHYSFKVNNNKLRIYPIPNGDNPDKFWIDFRAAEDAFEEGSDRKYGADGVNSMNTLPFPNMPYKNINSIGKQWIRRFALSLSKETLGQVRSKLGAIPIPGDSVTLNGPALVSEAKEEQSSLREELKTVLDELVYGKLAEGDAQMQKNITEVMAAIPYGIYVG